MEINRNRDFVTKSLQTIYDKFADREESEDDDSDMDEDEDEDMNIEAEYWMLLNNLGATNLRNKASATCIYMKILQTITVSTILLAL